MASQELRTGKELEQKYDIVVDAMAPLGREIIFPPAGGMKIRSEVRLDHIFGKSNGALAMIGGKIPGQRMCISLGKNGGSCKIVDCMNLQENSSIDAKMRDLTTKDEFRQFKYDVYVKDIDFSISKKEMPQWLYWIRRIVDHGRFKILKGKDKIPSYRKIIEMAGGTLVVSDDYGTTPKTKDTQPFNTISTDDLVDEPEKAGAGK